MSKYLIDVELDGYDIREEMLEACSKDEVYNALDAYSFTVISIEKVEQDT